MHADVLVLGAGLAGLSCARDLAEGGADVLVVEARDRPGGRVEHGVLADGRSVELGGEIVGPIHHAYLELVAELGLQVVPSYTDEPGETAYDLLDRVEFGERWLDREDLAALERSEAGLVELSHSVDPADPWSHPDAARLERLWIGDYLREQNATADAYRYVELHSVGAGGGRLGRSSLLGTLRSIAAGGGHLKSDYEAWESLKVEGGSSTLVGTLADSLGERIRFGEPVRRVEIGSRCTVELDSGERLEADSVACAIPVGPLRDVAVSGLSDARLQSLRRQRQ